jgi:MoxR-like ATPase
MMRPAVASVVKAELNVAISNLRHEFESGDSKKIAEEVSRLEARIKEVAEMAGGVSIQINQQEPREIDGIVHHVFKKAFTILSANRQLLMVGQAGTGKSTLGKQFADALGLPFGFINCTSGMSESWLIGRLLPSGEYVSSQFVDLYENGGVFLIDEVDAADSNTLMILQQALSNGHMAVPSRPAKPIATKHKDFYVAVSGNTWGFGSSQYSARNVLDAAFLDRFTCAKVVVEYDKKIEKSLTVDCPEWADYLWNLRSKIEDNKLRRVVSTRAFSQGASLLAHGMSEADVKEIFFEGWTKEEVAKVK